MEVKIKYKIKKKHVLVNKSIYVTVYFCHIRNS